MKRATFRASDDSSEAWDGTWHCYHDGQLLGWRSRVTTSAWLQPDLVPLNRAVDGHSVYGLSARTHRLGKSTRARQGEFVDTPIVVYCPAKPRCGRSQRVG